MQVWKDAAIGAIYTLAPTHCGSGQTTGAVDLPIARDAANGFPVLPATSIKGVARELFDSPDKNSNSTDDVSKLFGPDLHGAEKEGAKAGALSFTEARLVAYPARSVNRPFLHVTCPLILEHLARDLRAFGLRGPIPDQWPSSRGSHSAVQVASSELAGSALVIEDLVYSTNEVYHSKEVAALGVNLADLLPDDDEGTRRRLAEGLVVIPDSDFADLIQRAVPVQARIKLTSRKTTDTWTDPESGREESGNLWYEEHLPSDCLLVGFVGERRQRHFSNGREERSSINNLRPLERFRERLSDRQVIQIGGNETVGQGVCYWTIGKRERGGTS